MIKEGTGNWKKVSWNLTCQQSQSPNYCVLFYLIPLIGGFMFFWQKKSVLFNNSHRFHGQYSWS